MTISTPLSVATDGRDAMVVFGMNGEALPREHGFPVRMVIPGLYGFVSATKWLTKLTLTTYDDQEAYWTERKWATDAPVKISSRIDTPAPLSNSDRAADSSAASPGRRASASRASRSASTAVPGKPATLGADAGNDYWRQWYLEWDAKPGQHFLSSRATNNDGDVQTDVRMTPFPEGSSGIQNISVNIA